MDESKNEQEHEHPERPSVYLTNYFSWIHNAAWGAQLDVKNLGTAEEARKILRGKRIEAFFWPDGDLMGKLALYGVIPMPTLAKTPQEANEQLENGFFNYLNNAIVQNLGRAILETNRPKPLEVDKPMIVCQFVLAQGTGAIETAVLPTLKVFWFQVTAREVYANPKQTVAVSE